MEAFKDLELGFFMLPLIGVPREQRGMIRAAGGQSTAAAIGKPCNSKRVPKQEAMDTSISGEISKAFPPLEGKSKLTNSPGVKVLLCIFSKNISLVVGRF